VASCRFASGSLVLAYRSCEEENCAFEEIGQGVGLVVVVGLLVDVVIFDERE
jgi:hypothetical protein